MITITHKGGYTKFEKWLNELSGNDYLNRLDSAAQHGCDVLSSVTPMETGLTSSSWTYRIERGAGMTTIHWLNTAENGDFQIAMSLQYGHGTGTGGWVPGRDFINPAIQPIMDQIANEVWRRVTST